MRAILAAGLLALALATPALAAHTGWTPDELERELTCPTCQTTLAMSDAPVADRMRAFIRARHAAGDTKAEVRERLVAEFGEGVLAAPPAEGFNLLAWLLPIGGALAAALVLGFLAWRWAGGEKRERAADPSSNGRVSLDPELERRLDEELARFEG
ncbi:MAG TPA: cytochrome c-type biogenesis protein [Gaiellaceae bacterium]|nr:cytochrome c-type biogenesis protein [Gaiellaceae bacterium]